MKKRNYYNTTPSTLTGHDVSDLEVVACHSGEVRGVPRVPYSGTSSWGVSLVVPASYTFSVGRDVIVSLSLRDDIHTNKSGTGAL